MIGRFRLGFSRCLSSFRCYVLRFASSLAEDAPIMVDTVVSNLVVRLLRPSVSKYMFRRNGWVRWAAKLLRSRLMPIPLFSEMEFSILTLILISVFAPAFPVHSFFSSLLSNPLLWPLLRLMLVQMWDFKVRLVVQRALALKTLSMWSTSYAIIWNFLIFRVLEACISLRTANRS